MEWVIRRFELNLNIVIGYRLVLLERRVAKG